VITLREDQAADVQKIREALAEHKSVLFRAPCRYGKTVTSAYMAQRSVARGKRVVFACHRDSILQSAAATFARFGIKFGYIAAGRPSNPFAMAQVASADTLRNRLHMLKDVALLVVDESHLWNSLTRKRIIDAAKEAGALIVGLSATPIRLDGKPLRDLFDYMVLGPTESELIGRGSLAQYRVFAPVSTDTTGVKMSGKDFAASDLAERFDKPAIIGDAVETWKKYAAGLRTVVYCINRAHGKHVLEGYLAAGVKAAYIDGETSKAEQLRIANGVADGLYDVLVSVELLTTGFDLGSLIGRNVTIQCVQLLRHTTSLQLAIQMMMRCMTPWDGVSIILDHVNMILNRDGTVNHGFPDDDREWSLDGPPTRKQDGVTAFNVWTCEVCFASVRETKPVCPYCTTEHTVKAREITVEAGELLEIKRAQAVLKKEKQRQVQAARDLPSIASLALERNYSAGWVAQRMKALGLRAASFSEIHHAMHDARKRVAA